ncbi:MAG: hypothetical protein IJI49_02185 [Bacilli bacterium]|nr:hypothetical protein [Bacilli bacterium]
MSINVIKEYAEFSKKSISKYYELIMGKFYDKNLVDKFLNEYINIRYYDLDTDKYSRNITKINKKLNEVYNNIEEKQKEAKFIHIMFDIMLYLDDVLEIDNIENIFSLINQIRKEKLGINEKDFISKFKENYEKNIERKNKFIESITCEEFPVEYDYIYEQDVYNVTITHDIAIPKLYSKFAIDKVFNDGLIAEDKLFIEYYIVSNKILNNIIKGDYNNKYLLEFNLNILKKKDKLSRLLNIIDNDLTKDVTSMKLEYKGFIANKEKIYELIKEGFKFSIIIDNTYDNVEKIETDLFKVFEYIIINNKEKYKEFDDYNNIISY